MQTVDIKKLESIIESESKDATENMLHLNTFALACYLHATGNLQAGLKQLQTLFDHLGRDRRKTYFDRLESSLPGNEERYALAVWANTEIKDLFPRQADGLEQGNV